MSLLQFGPFEQSMQNQASDASTDHVGGDEHRAELAQRAAEARLRNLLPQNAQKAYLDICRYFGVDSPGLAGRSVILAWFSPGSYCW